MARLFAARDAALGVAVLQSRGDDARGWLELGMAVDVADIVALALARRRRAISWRTTTISAAFAFLALVLEARALQRE